MKLAKLVRGVGSHSRAPRSTVFAVALLTVVAGQAGAADIPNVPLHSGASYPPANVRFILDDSGSMNSFAMPGDAYARRDMVDADNDPVDGLDDTLTDRFYGNNTIFYDPRVTYQPWIKADNTRYTSGRSYSSVWSHSDLLQDAVDLSAGVETIFFPKAGATDLTVLTSFYRFQIRTVGGVTRIVRASDWGGWLRPTGLPRNNLADTSGTANNYANSRSFEVPTGLTRMIVTLGGGRHGTNGDINNGGGDGANLYVGRDDDPTNGGTCFSTSASNVEVCTIDNPPAGTWYAGIQRGSRYTGVTMDVTFYAEDSTGCSTLTTGWRTCTYDRPSIPATAPATGMVTRSEADELTNFATWYSYHSSRMKVAKAGASEAFAQLGPTLRIGYDTIWARNPFDIPVGTDNGVFRNTNRSTWFDRLHAAEGSAATPLKTALQRAGEYFKDTSATGPWGPETGADQLSCRQNFAILTTDGFWNENPGFTPVGDADGTAGTTITDGVAGGRSFTYSPARPYLDNFSTDPNSQPDTLADVAMQYWKNDLVTGLANNVPTSSADPAFWQHMTTFGVSIGLNGKLNPRTDLPSITNGSKRWGDPTDREDADRIDDLWHASVNGRGSFIVASNTRQFQRGLLDAFASIAQRMGSASNVTANSTSFTSDTRVFQASYVTGKWHGELAAYDATRSGVAANPSWRASARLAAAVPADRKLFTWDGTRGTTFPTASQLAALDQSARTAAPATSAQNLAYLRGDRSMEGSGGLRVRETLLGDVVHSSPFYLQATESIYVGANDGMLHGFNADTGDELFAYVPGMVSAADLGKLSDPYYVHQYFVDGPVVVSSPRQTPGKSLLIGSLGRGGKGLFGLDVTDPAGFGSRNVLWELSGTTDRDLGLVLGEPLIAKLNGPGNPVVAIVGNGYNSTNGSAVLLVVDLETGAVLNRINTLASGDNGLSAPRGRDNDGNGTVDVVYAGDRQGNMWKFDFASGTGSVANGGRAMFTAPAGQPITTGLAIGKDPANNKSWVFFGTGSFLTRTDPADVTLQSIYGVIDEGTTTLTRTNLKERDIVVSTRVNGTALRGFEPPGALALAEKGWFVDLDTPTRGERIVSRPQLVGTSLVFASIIPPVNTSCEAGGSGYVNALDAFTGASTGEPFFLFDVNGDGVINDSDRLANPRGGPGVPVGSMDLGVGMPTLPIIIEELLVVGGSTGELGEARINPQGAAARRASWQEIEGN